MKKKLAKPKIQVEEKKDLDNEDKDNIIKSQTFNSFFVDASKYIEKLLEQDEVEKERKISINKEKVVEFEIQLKKPGKMKNVTIGELNWSKLMPEVFLSVYLDKDDVAKREMETNDVFHIWNTQFLKRPEFELHSNSKVQTAIFSPFASETVIAGCESGSISIYDLRAKKEPVIKSTPSIEAHRTPVNGLKIIGGRNSNNLVSISEEGRMCIWSLSKITMPIRKVDLFPPINPKEKSNEFEFLLEPFSLSSIPGDTSSVFIGTNDNNIY